MSPALRAAGVLAAAALTLLPSALGAGTAQVAFTGIDGTGHADVVLVGADGTGLVDLTPGQRNAYDDDRTPTWSPDGTRLAFVSHRDGAAAQEIYVMNADGTAPRRLTSDSGTGAISNLDPAWSPDGRRIAWRKAGRNSTDEIWVMNADGSGQRRLTTDGGAKTAPLWSPDSLRLLYARRGTSSQAFVVDAAGGLARLLTPQGAADATPAWSPDGRQVALQRNGRIWVLNADGTSPHAVSAAMGFQPAWSPDGKKIAFTGTRLFPELGTRFGPAIRTDVYVVDPDGGNERRLTGPFGDDYVASATNRDPSWWPDGSRIAFSPGGTTWTMNADGTCEEPFGPSNPRLTQPAWRPGAAAFPERIGCVDLRITVSASTDAVGLRQSVVLHVQIDNDGTETATGLRIQARGVGRISLFGSLEGCGRGANITCTLPSLPAGLSTSFELYASSAIAGRLDATVSASSNQADSDPSSNTARALATVLPCTTVGTLGNDAINGTPRADRICARAGWDRINALAGNDMVDAGSGNDTIDGGKGRDTIMGGDGADVIVADDGERDTIDCGAGKDVVVADRLDRVAANCEQVARR